MAVSVNKTVQTFKIVKISAMDDEDKVRVHVQDEEGYHHDFTVSKDDGINMMLYDELTVILGSHI